MPNSCIDVPLPQYLERLDAKPAPAKKARQSSGSDSDGSGGESSSGEEDEDDGQDVPLQSSGEGCCSEDLAHFSVVAHCPALVRDKEALPEGDVFVINQVFAFVLCFSLCVTQRTQKVDDQIKLGLLLHPSFLSNRVATAWGIERDLDLLVELRDLSAAQYCSSAVPPTVRICQTIEGLRKSAQRLHFQN